MNWLKRNKPINSDEYLELKQAHESLRIEFKGLEMEFELVMKKLKLKYKIPTKNQESEDIKTSVLLPM